MLPIAKLVEVALVVVALAATNPPLKVLSAEKLFVVVVLKAVVKTPVFELYANGYTALCDVEEILLLKFM